MPKLYALLFFIGILPLAANAQGLRDTYKADSLVLTASYSQGTGLIESASIAYTLTNNFPKGLSVGILTRSMVLGTCKDPDFSGLPVVESIKAILDNKSNINRLAFIPPGGSANGSAKFFTCLGSALPRKVVTMSLIVASGDEVIQVSLNAEAR